MGEQFQGTCLNVLLELQTEIHLHVYQKDCKYTICIAIFSKPS